ncbi:MAG: hypothetical protein ACW98Y_02400 [Candidatus Thorarchaeota archaeon]
MEQILAVFESPQDSPKVVVSSESSKSVDIQRDVKSKRLQTGPPEYDLYITDLRFICAVVWDEETDVPEETSLPYDVTVHQSYAPTKAEKRASHQGKTPDEIKELHPKSLSIPFDEVDWVKIKKGFFGAYVEISSSSIDEKPFKIPIPKKKYNEAKSILDDHLGNKLR